MGDIKIKPMALFILTKGPSLVKISFFGVGGAAPQKSIFLPQGPRNFYYGTYNLELV